MLQTLANPLRAQDALDLPGKERNTAIRGAAAAIKGQVVFIGNSITEAWLQINPEFFSGKPYINRGISGQTSSQMLGRFRRDVIALQPRVVVILAGTNDIAGNGGRFSLQRTKANIAAMVRLATAHNIRVVLASLLHVTAYPWRPHLRPAAKIAALNHWLRAFAHQNHLVYLDLFTPLADAQNGLNAAYSDDGVHPNKEGYRIMGPLTDHAIRQALSPQ